MTQAPVWQWSAVETARAIRSGRVASEEVVDGHVRRLRSVNPTLNGAVVDLTGPALAAARARAAGEPLGGVLAEATILEGEAYMKAIALRSRLTRDWLVFLETWPVILAPAAVQPTPPPGADLADAAAAVEARVGVMARTLWARETG